jgi:hypothetical protein
MVPGGRTPNGTVDHLPDRPTLENWSGLAGLAEQSENGEPVFRPYGVATDPHCPSDHRLTPRVAEGTPAEQRSLLVVRGANRGRRPLPRNPPHKRGGRSPALFAFQTGRSVICNTCGPAQTLEDFSEVSNAAAKRAWARLIKQVYEVDPLIRPRCAGPMRIIAARLSSRRSLHRATRGDREDSRSSRALAGGIPQSPSRGTRCRIPCTGSRCRVIPLP